MALKTIYLQCTATYDDAVTTADAVADALDVAFGTALSTPALLDDLGNPDISGLEIIDTADEINA